MKKQKAKSKKIVSNKILLIVLALVVIAAGIIVIGNYAINKKVKVNVLKTSASNEISLENFEKNPPKDNNGREQKFQKFEAMGKVVYFSQRMIGDAIVEKDQSVYVFEKANGKLKEKNISFKPGLQKDLPANLISKKQAEGLVDGNVKFSNLYYAADNSDIFKINFDRTRPIWAVTSTDSNNEDKITVIDAIDGKKLGNAIAPPSAAYSMTGPQYYGTSCSASWLAWSTNAANWFQKMGYPITSKEWPLRSEMMSIMQDSNVDVFYELAHGSSSVLINSCSERIYASDISNWIANSNPKRFSFFGSCDGLCNTSSTSFSYAIRKGSTADAATVGYCGMSGNANCSSSCWPVSLSWQDKLFSYLGSGDSVKVAFEKANIDYPACGVNNCMRMDGDPNVTLNKIVDSQNPTVSITSPTTGKAISGNNVYVSASASDNISVLKVEFYKDGVLMNADTASPYYFYWDTTLDADGEHTLQAKAYDNAGNVGVSSLITVKVTNSALVSCTDFVYSSWGECKKNNTQTRTVISGIPTGCTGGSPILTQSCILTPICKSFSYSAWSACVNKTQSRTITGSSPAGCTGGNPTLTRKCR